MTMLLLDGGPVAPDAPVTRTGGAPLGPVVKLPSAPRRLARTLAAPGESQVRPVRGLPPGAPRARTRRRGAALRATTGVRRQGPAPVGTTWPACAVCAAPLQFLAQIRLGDLPGHTAPTPGLLALLMCANRPGQCAQWSPTGGGNLALLLPAGGLQPLPAPDSAAQDLLELGAVRAAVPAHVAPATATVLGRLGGSPDWLQYDETPGCPSCEQPMDFVAELAEGPDPVTAMNFGSGRAYAHTCTPCGRAALLWQC